MLLLSEALEWIATTNGIITLLTGLMGLITTGIGAYFAIKNWRYINSGRLNIKRNR